MDWIGLDCDCDCIGLDCIGLDWIAKGRASAGSCLVLVCLLGILEVLEAGKPRSDYLAVRY